MAEKLCPMCGGNTGADNRGGIEDASKPIHCANCGAIIWPGKSVHVYGRDPDEVKDVASTLMEQSSGQAENKNGGIPTKLLKYMNDHKIAGSVIFVGVCIVALGAFTEALSNIAEFISENWPGGEAPTNDKDDAGSGTSG